MLVTIRDCSLQQYIIRSMKVCKMCKLVNFNYAVYLSSWLNQLLISAAIMLRSLQRISPWSTARRYVIKFTNSLYVGLVFHIKITVRFGRKSSMGLSSWNNTSRYMGVQLICYLKNQQNDQYQHLWLLSQICCPIPKSCYQRFFFRFITSILQTQK